MKLKHRAFATEGIEITAATLGQILSEVVQRIALVAPGTLSGGELAVMSPGIAEAQCVFEAAKVTLLILAPLLLLVLILA